MSTLVSVLFALLGAIVLYFVFSLSVVIALFKANKELEEATESASDE